MELTDARLVARDSVLSSASTYLIHARGGEACELALENCGLRGFSLLVLDQEAGARCALKMHRSTLAVLGSLLSPRGRAFPETSVTGSRNLLRCGTLAWKSDGSGSTLDAVEWRMGDSVIGGLRAPFGRDSTIRQMAPDRDSAREKFTARWPDAARTIHFVDDLGLPGLQEQNLTPETFSNDGEWSEYGYRR